jgi:hypothetical protein
LFAAPEPPDQPHAEPCQREVLNHKLALVIDYQLIGDEAIKGYLLAIARRTNNLPAKRPRQAAPD